MTGAEKRAERIIRRAQAAIEAEKLRDPGGVPDIDLDEPQITPEEQYPKLFGNR